MDENKLLNFFKKNFNFFSGVPDSLLSSFTKKLKGKKIVHLIASNEGAAISHGIGYFLAKKKVPCIYFQNSGLGNSINPIISIAHKTVYSLPLFIVIGWRGAPGSNDEPQHMAKGNITPHMLKLLGIKTFILKKNNHIYNLKKLKNLLTFSKKNNVPVACLIKKSVIINKSKSELKRLPKKFLRNSLIESVLKKIKKGTKIISTTGYTSRELYQIRKNNNYKNGKDFYMVGGMGHTLSVALTHAMFQKQSTICLDGDGSLIMHLGAIVACSKYSKNFKYILINNFSHESVGGQNTNSEIIDFKSLSKSVGFDTYMKITDSKNIDKKIDYFLTSRGKIFLEAKVDLGSLKNLGRPKNLINIKKDFLLK